MTILNLIKQTYKRESFAFLHLHEIYRLNPLVTKSSIRSAISRAVSKGQLEAVGDQVYFYDYKPTYQEFLHAKRIYDTNKQHAKHSFDIDLEMTCIGFAPVNLSIREIEDIVNPKLLDRSLEILDDEGIYLFEAIIDFRVTGSEWKNKKKETFDNNWIVEIKMVNNIGVHYIFTGNFYLEESEWPR